MTGNSTSSYLIRGLDCAACGLKIEDAIISVPLGCFKGLGRASRRGILIKGSNFLDALSAVKTVVFDKTGALTQSSWTASTPDTF